MLARKTQIYEQAMTKSLCLAQAAIMQHRFREYVHIHAEQNNDSMLQTISGMF